MIENEILCPNPEVVRENGFKKSIDRDILIVDTDRKLSDIRQGQKILMLHQNTRLSKPKFIEDDLKCNEQFAASPILYLDKKDSCMTFSGPSLQNWGNK